ncbi:hypothetical protein [Streptomyces sp. NPDC002463]|uniref:hypothetical protein n=1 Tax=Streptomyces sp. NPDC002463 TaxID=3364645 RepID=UPI0036C33051
MTSQASVCDVYRSPGPLAGLDLDALTDHYAGIANSPEAPPVIAGHSVGGPVAQHLIAADMGRGGGHRVGPRSTRCSCPVRRSTTCVHLETTAPTGW